MSQELIKRIKAIQSDYEEKSKEAERAAGALAEAMRTLKEEFECDTVEEAQAVLEEWKEEIDEKTEKLEKAVAAYEAAWTGEENEED